MEVSVTVGALDGTGLGSEPPSPPMAEQPRPSAKTNSMEITAMAICRVCAGLTIQPHVTARSAATKRSLCGDEIASPPACSQ